jgi:hypothetical protein
VTSWALLVELSVEHAFRSGPMHFLWISLFSSLPGCISRSILPVNPHRRHSTDQWVVSPSESLWVSPTSSLFLHFGQRAESLSPASMLIRPSISPKGSASATRKTSDGPSRRSTLAARICRLGKETCAPGGFSSCGCSARLGMQANMGLSPM